MFYNTIRLSKITYAQFLTLARNEDVIKIFPDLKERLLLSTSETERSYQDAKRMTYDSTSTYRMSPGRQDTLNPMAEYESQLSEMPQEKPLRIKIRKYICRILAEEWEAFDIAVKIEFLRFVEDSEFYDDETMTALLQLANCYATNESKDVWPYYVSARLLQLMPLFPRDTYDELPKYVAPLNVKELQQASEKVLLKQYTVRVYRQLFSCIANLAIDRTRVQLGLQSLSLKI